MLLSAVSPPTTSTRPSGRSAAVGKVRGSWSRPSFSTEGAGRRFPEQRALEQGIRERGRFPARDEHPPVRQAGRRVAQHGEWKLAGRREGEGLRVPHLGHLLTSADDEDAAIVEQGRRVIHAADRHAPAGVDTPVAGPRELGGGQVAQRVVDVPEPLRPRARADPAGASPCGSCAARGGMPGRSPASLSVRTPDGGDCANTWAEVISRSASATPVIRIDCRPSVDRTATVTPRRKVVPRASAVKSRSARPRGMSSGRRSRDAIGNTCPVTFAANRERCESGRFRAVSRAPGVWDVAARTRWSGETRDKRS